MINRIMLV